MRPYLEVSNGRATLAYINPVVRIVAMDGSVERLEKIAADISYCSPGLDGAADRSGAARQ